MNKKAMKYQSARFFRGDKVEPVEADEGMLRQNLGYDDSIFMAKVIF